MTDSVSVPKELFDFLMGSGTLDGCWFGDRPINAKGAFWWRDRLRDRAAIDTPNPAESVASRHPLEAYADSYAQMARMGDGRVDCRSVEVDIRQNMIPVTRAAPPSAARERELVEALEYVAGIPDYAIKNYKGNVAGKISRGIKVFVRQTLARYQKEAE